MITLSFHLKFGQSLFRAATHYKAEEKVLADLGTVLELFQDKELKNTYQQLSYLPADASRKVITDTFKDKFHTLVVNLLVLLAQRNALKTLPKIEQVYRDAYHKSKGIVEMTIRTSRKFSQDEERNFIQKLQSKKHQPLSVRFEHDPALIAGVQVYEKSYLTDYSARNYLETLKKHLLSQQLS